MYMSSKRRWFRALQNLTTEYSFESLAVEGQIPQDLKGTLYRVGTGKFTAFEKRLPHWFDGDGAVSAIEINNGQAFGAAKLIKTAGGQAEEKAGKHFLNSFGFSSPSFLRRLLMTFRNPANTSIFSWNNRLFALYEACLPTEISPQDLSTIGETDLGGQIRSNFSAHPRYVPSRKASYNFGLSYFPAPTIDLIELKDDGTSKRLGSIPFRGSTFIHDFIATENYLVFFAAPIYLNVASVIFKGTSISDSMSWKQEKGTQVIVVPINNPKKHWSFQTDTIMTVHFFNGFERGDKIIIDAISYPDFSNVERVKYLSQGINFAGTPGKIIRKELNLRTRTLEIHEISDLSCEFPQVSPKVFGKEHQWGYTLSYISHEDTHLTYFNSISKTDLNTGETKTISFGEDHYPSEPIFVPKESQTSEDDGYILTLVYDGREHQNYVAIIDAKKFSHEPIAKVYLNGFFPLTFHGTWVDSVR